jgi:hypothetical protein
MSSFKIYRQDILSEESKIKILLTKFIFDQYEETVFYGKSLRIYDPKGIFTHILTSLTAENNVALTILKSFPEYNR